MTWKSMDVKEVRGVIYTLESGKTRTIIVKQRHTASIMPVINLPGGMMEPNDITTISCIEREISEELNVKCSIKGNVATFENCGESISISTEYFLNNWYEHAIAVYYILVPMSVFNKIFERCHVIAPENADKPEFNEIIERQVFDLTEKLIKKINNKELYGDSRLTAGAVNIMKKLYQKARFRQCNPTRV